MDNYENYSHMKKYLMETYSDIWRLQERYGLEMSEYSIRNLAPEGTLEVRERMAILSSYLEPGEGIKPEKYEKIKRVIKRLEQAEIFLDHIETDGDTEIHTATFPFSRRYDTLNQLLQCWEKDLSESWGDSWETTQFFWEDPLYELIIQISELDGKTEWRLIFPIEKKSADSWKIIEKIISLLCEFR